MNNITNIPRYKASMPIQTTFITNANASGDHVFEQIARKGNVAVYKRNRVSNGRLAGYETIVIKTVKAGTVYVKGGVPTELDTESYPGESSFGKLGFFCKTEKRALAKMEELTAVDIPVVSIPNGKFTLIQFAEVNKLPVSKETAMTITELLTSKKIRFIGTETINEQPVQFFSKM